MIARIRLQRRQLGPCCIPLVAYAIQRDPQGIGRLGRFLRGLNRVSGCLGRVLGRLAADKPAQRQTAQKSDDDGNNGDDGVQNESLFDKNEKRT